MKAWIPESPPHPHPSTVHYQIPFVSSIMNQNLDFNSSSIHPTTLNLECPSVFSKSWFWGQLRHFSPLLQHKVLLLMVPKITTHTNESSWPFVIIWTEMGWLVVVDPNFISSGGDERSSRMRRWRCRIPKNTKTDPQKGEPDRDESRRWEIFQLIFLHLQIQHYKWDGETWI